MQILQPMRQKYNVAIFIIWMILLFGGVIFLAFSCSPTKPSSITIVPVAEVDQPIYDLIDGKTDRLIP